MTTREHKEVCVGGPLDEARLRRVMVRAFRLRNLCISEAEAFTFKDRHEPNEVPAYSDMGMDNHRDGETPTLVEYESTDDELAHIDLHVGCGDGCPVLARIPYDGDSGGVDQAMAEAIAHSGRDLIDLVREVQRLRKEVAHWEQSASMACQQPPEDCGCPGCHAAALFHGRVSP